MVSPAEAPFVYVFAALLGSGAVVALFVPLLRHIRTYGASRAVLTAVVALLVGLSFAAIAWVAYAASDPAYFVPVAAVTVILRLASPTLLYHGIQERYEVRRDWPWIQWGLIAGFVMFAGFAGYNLVRIIAGQEPSAVAGVSEQLAMSLGASALIVRTALRFRPRFTVELWPLWIAGTLIAIAFVLVAPYAFPVFAPVYLVSGLAGWIVGALVIRFVD